MDTGNLPPSFPTVIPPDVCKLLDLHAGDVLRLEVCNGEVVVKKHHLPLDMNEPSEREYLALMEATMTEWQDEKDDEILPAWNQHGTV